MRGVLQGDDLVNFSMRAAASSCLKKGFTPTKDPCIGMHLLRLTGRLNSVYVFRVSNLVPLKVLRT